MSKRFIIIFIFLFLYIFIFANFVFAAPAETETKDLAIRLSGALGGIVSGLPEFIERLYNWMIAIAGGLATVMIMIAGFIWLTAAGNPTRIKQAKEMISNAIIGLFLALGAFIILNTINPTLLNLKMPTILPINRITTTFEESLPIDCTEARDRTTCERMDNCIWVSIELLDAEQSLRIVGETAGRYAWLASFPLILSYWGEETSITEELGGAAGAAVGRALISERRGICVRPDPHIGTVGHACREIGTGGSCNTEGCCNEGFICVETLGGVASRKLCTDGRANSPCRRDEDCGDGLTCHSASRLCMGATDRSGGMPCRTNEECASGFCNLLRGICATSSGGLGTSCMNDTNCIMGLFCCNRIDRTTTRENPICPWATDWASGADLDVNYCATTLRDGERCLRASQCINAHCEYSDGRDADGRIPGTCCGGPTRCPSES